MLEGVLLSMFDVLIYFLLRFHYVSLNFKLQRMTGWILNSKAYNKYCKTHTRLWGNTQEGAISQERNSVKHEINDTVI